MSQIQGIEISLKPIAGGINRVLPPGINQVMQQEYANKYLKSIGAYPTRDNIDFVLNNMAIKDALVLPVWARSKIVIIPGMGLKAGDGGLNMNELLSENKPIVDKKKTKKKDKRSAERSGSGTNRSRESRRSATEGSEKGNEDDDAIIIKPEDHGNRGRKLSWATVQTFDLLEPLAQVLHENRRTAFTFRSLLHPPEFNQEDVQKSLMDFITALPDYVPRVKYDQTFKLFKSVRRLLKADVCVELYGLLVRYCYWNLVRPAAKQAIHSIREEHPEGRDFDDVNLNFKESQRSLTAATGTTSTANSSQYAASATSAASGEFGPTSASTGDGEKHIDMSSLQYVEREKSAGGVEKLFFDGLQLADGEVLEGNLEGRQPGTGSNVAIATATATSTNNTANSNENSPKRVEFFNHERSSSHATTGSGGSPVAAMERRGVGGGGGGGSRGNGQRMPSSSSRGNVTFSEQDVSIIEDVEGGDEDVDTCIQSEVLSKDGTLDTGAASLTREEKEMLFMHLETCVMTLFRKVGRRRMDLVTGRQALVTCCHFIVDDLLTTIYPWFSSLPDSEVEAVKQMENTSSRPNTTESGRSSRPSTGGGSSRGSTPNLGWIERQQQKKGMKDVDDREQASDAAKQLNLRLRRLVHQGLSDIIDPARLYTSSMLLADLTGHMETRNLSNHGKCRFYTTSLATKSLLGDTTSAQARKFLEQGRGLYAVVPGAVEPYHVRNGRRVKAGAVLTPAQQHLQGVLRDIEAVEESHATTMFLQAHAAEQQRLRRRWEKSQSRKQTSGTLDSGDDDDSSSDGSDGKGGGGGGGRRRRSRPGSKASMRSRSPGSTGGASDSKSGRAISFSVVSPSGKSNFSSSRKSNTQQSPSRMRHHHHHHHHHHHRSRPRRPLDFTRLFSDQPEAGYFPDLKADREPAGNGTGTKTTAGNRTAASKSPARQQQQPTLTTLTNTSAGFKDALDIAMMPGFQRPPSPVTLSLQQQQPQQSQQPQQLVQQSQESKSVNSKYSSSMDGLGLGDASHGTGVTTNASNPTEIRVSAYNQAAAVPISLTSKSSLMHLMVGKTTAIYGTQIQTNLTTERIALLRPQNVPSP